MVTLTRELIDSGMSMNGGLNGEQLRLLGLQMPLKTGWKTRAVGQQITDDDYERFVLLKNAHLHPNGKQMSRRSKEVDAAVKQERERCAKILESMAVYHGIAFGEYVNEIMNP